MPKSKENTKSYPLIPLRGLTVFPHMVIHFDVGRPASVEALERAMADDQTVLLVTQKNAETEQPSKKDLYGVGVLAKVRQVLNLPGDNLRVLAEGEKRAVIRKLVRTENHLRAEANVVREKGGTALEAQAMMRVAREKLETYAEHTGQVPSETLQSVNGIEDAGMMADVIASNVLTRLEDRQSVLDETEPLPRLEKVCALLMRETELAGVERSIQERLKSQVDKNQKDYYLREQIKAIQEELGDKDGGDVEDLRERLEKTPLSDEAREKVLKELDRITRMAPGMPEITVSRTWVEWVLDLPWGVETKDNLDLRRAKKILDEDHYAMERVKERIIEFLAVRAMKAAAKEDTALKGPILCFAGPPGVGKTSIVRAIARAMGRKYVRMSLGGVRDEAEIRGHRRTYVGAMPGRIIAGMKKAGSMNPLFLFDEIDKMSSDFRGDPASAMLEVLDGEQNDRFADHYMEIPVDLSRVMFVTTANTVDAIPPALRDRMEIIEVPSYTEEEKLNIARKHLLPKQLEAHGFEKKSVQVPDAVMKTLIEGWTREAGVRELERIIAKVTRKAAVERMNGGELPIKVTGTKLEEYLGGPRFLREMPEKAPLTGIVNGLAYTEVGGETLTVECLAMPGTGQLTLTGKLGEVMQESARAALSYVRAHAKEWGVPEGFAKETDLHVHVPEGAVPKDGPSAGVTLLSAMVSALSGRKCRQDVAMTGEITLRGRVLPIGGVKEKLLAAYRAGIRCILLPEENRKDLEDIPPYVLDSFEIHYARQAEDVLSLVLLEKE